MAFIHTAQGAAAPHLSEDRQAEASRKARWASSPSDWLSLAVDHHDAIRQGFEACGAAVGGAARATALKQLRLVLNGHAIAEELVLYPALTHAGESLAAGQAYVEQATTKLQISALERIDPAADRWLDDLDRIRAAVLHHMHEEETGWFLVLKEKAEDQAYLTRRYREEFERYAGEVLTRAVSPEPRSFAKSPITTGELDRY